MGLRASIAGFWLRQLGFEVAVVRLTEEIRSLEPFDSAGSIPAPDGIGASDALQAVQSGNGCFVDVRSSASFQAGHVSGALWGIRPRFERLLLERNTPVHLIGDDVDVTALAAKEFDTLGFVDVHAVEGGQQALIASGATIEVSPNTPGPEDAIDFLHFVHDRHDGNLESSRRYLAWEQGLIAQLDEAERASFRLTLPSVG
jgi:rhodanese-related sulfurtransferase